MSKKRAFVKYTKAGELIPGSLIITTKGGFPKDGVYKEVDVDLCCDPICPPPIVLPCYMLKNNTLDVQTVEGCVCLGTSTGDHDVEPGETICMQFQLASTGGFIEMGPCQP